MTKANECNGMEYFAFIYKMFTKKKEQPFYLVSHSHGFYECTFPYESISIKSVKYTIAN